MVDNIRMVFNGKSTLKEYTCHGCNGKGWVQTWRGAERCPVCGGSGRLEGNEYWCPPPNWYPDEPQYSYWHIPVWCSL